LIKTIIKLALLAAFANAAWHLFIVYSAHYKFDDGVTYAAQYRGVMTDDQVRERVLELAAQLDVPVDASTLVIKREDKRTVVRASYIRPVELFPGFIRQWPFTLDVAEYPLPLPEGDGLSGPKK
jgi:hypothetical protein